MIPRNPLISLAGALILGALCVGCLMDPEPKTHVIDCGDLYLDSFPDPIPPAPADTFVVKDGECRQH